MKTSNNLKYNISKTVGKETIDVKIRLNDECKNGNQDFSITGDIYKAGLPKTDRNHISGGCIHEDILKAFPEFKIFVDLHLSDYKGIKMYAVANGFYHLKEGFNDIKPNVKKFKKEFCKYYRISDKQFNLLEESKSEIQYALNLKNLGIIEQWEKEAKKGIELLESLTGEKFLIDSKKTNLDFPTEEEINEENNKIASGYYTKEVEEERELETKNKIIKELTEERDKEINKINTKFELSKQVLLLGGQKALDNSIFYSHTNELHINWKNYGTITDDEYNNIERNIILPKGVKIFNRKGKD